MKLPLWGGLVLGVLLGIVLQRSSFCARAALADAFEGKDKARLRSFLLAVLVTLLGTQLLAGYGLVNLGGTPYLRAGVPLLGLLVGGVLFGAGMMLAGGCPSRLIVRAAQGQGAALLSWLVFVLAIMASLEGVLAPVREILSGPAVQLPAASLPALLGGLPAWLVTVALAGLIVFFLLRAPRQSAWWGWRLPLAGAPVHLGHARRGADAAQPGRRCADGPGWHPGHGLHHRPGHGRRGHLVRLQPDRRGRHGAGRLAGPPCAAAHHCLRNRP
ncbi:MAG: YeeE/YedE thiosulfate transporter family protein [Hylemonella sp.]